MSGRGPIVALPGFPPDTIFSATAVRTQSLLAQNGPLALSRSFVSPLNRWDPVGDGTDTLRATFAGSICRVWTRIGELTAGATYNLEIRCVVLDAVGSPLTLRTYLVPGATAVSAPATPVQFESTLVTLGNATVQEPTFSGAILASSTPTRLLIEVTAGPVTVTPANAYKIFTVEPILTEV